MVQNAKRVVFEPALDVFSKISLSSVMYHIMLLENDPQLDIFNMKSLAFVFHEKHILEHTGTFDRKKANKKFFPKEWLDLHGFALLLTFLPIYVHIFENNYCTFYFGSISNFSTPFAARKLDSFFSHPRA